MPRLLALPAMLLTCLSFVHAADEPTLVEKMTVAERFSKVSADFATAMKQTGRDAKLQALAVATRNATLARIAEGAEAAKSAEHDELAKIYFLLDRFDDCVRQARLALKAKPTDYATQQKLILALGHQEKPEEALKELQRMLAADVASAEIPQYLSSASFTVAAFASLLSNKKDYDGAEAILTTWDKKLEALPLDTAPLKALKNRAMQATAQLRGRMEASKKRDALVGNPYIPIFDATWLNGPAIKPEELRGKVVLLDFWAVWCGPCIATFPHLREWQDKYADKGLVIIGVTNRYKFGWNAEAQSIVQKPDITPAAEDLATEEFLKYHNLKHRVAVMSDRELSAKYVVTGIPQAVLIDRNGIVQLIFVGSGEASAKLLEQGIRDALGLKTETASK